MGMSLVVKKKEYVRLKPYPERKVKMLNEYVEYLKRYRGFIIASIFQTPAQALYETRKKLREMNSVLKVIKNRVFLKAILKAYGDEELAKKLEPYLQGELAVIFTNANPFEIYLFVEKNKVYREARPVDIAPEDIVIPAGNTGIPPGPILSKFGKLKIPTKIQGGTIWVTKDTVVARKGETISADLAEILTRLGIKPIPIMLRLKAAYIDGIIIPEEQLKIDVGEYRSKVEEAVRNAINLAVNAAFPTPEAMPMILAKAHREAMALAAEAAFITKETAELVLGSAYAKALALASILSSKAPELGIQVAAAAPAAPAKEEKKEEEKKEEEKKEETSEEEIAGALAGLFG